MGISSLAGAGISAAGSLFGASLKSDAAKQAALYQEQAGQNAQNALNGTLSTSTDQLSPYTGTGSAAVQTLGNQLTGLATSSTSPSARYVNPLAYGTDASAYATSGTANNISADPYKTTGNFTQADLEATPGYQFTLSQGLKGVQNSAAARGLGVSGAALKGAATYATGLSDSTYNTRYNQQLQSNAQNFDQANTAANTNYSQQAGANEQNFSNDLNANRQNFGNALSAAGQNFSMDQTGFQDSQSGKNQDYNMLLGASNLGANATNALVGANTATGQSIANAMVGVGSAQAAAANASGQAWGSALQGVGETGANALMSYNAGQTLTGGQTFGNALNNYFGGNSNFLNNVSGAINKGGNGSGGTNV